MSSNISLHHNILDFLPTSKHLPIDAKLQMRTSDGASLLFPTLLEHGALIWIPPPRKLVNYLRFLSFIPQHRHLMIHLRNQNSFQLQSLYQDQLLLLQILSCSRLEGRSNDDNTGPCRFLRQ